VETLKASCVTQWEKLTTGTLRLVVTSALWSLIVHVTRALYVQHTDSVDLSRVKLWFDCEFRMKFSRKKMNCCRGLRNKHSLSTVQTQHTLFYHTFSPHIPSLLLPLPCHQGRERKKTWGKCHLSQPALEAEHMFTTNACPVWLPICHTHGCDGHRSDCLHLILPPRMCLLVFQHPSMHFRCDEAVWASYATPQCGLTGVSLDSSWK